MTKSNKKVEKSNFEDMLAREETSKQANKKAKKKLKKARNKLKQLAAVEKEAPIKSYTKTGQPSAYTVEERTIFQARIDNEKKNVLRTCQADAGKIIKFCEDNVADEKNAAVRFARQEMLAKAKTRLESSYYL